jgi:F0F1-type ATP synthase delta subunit
MKYSVHDYAKALAQAIITSKAKDQDAIAKHFLAVVRKHGDEASLRKILDEAGRIVRSAEDIRKVTITSARPLDPAQEKMVKEILKKDDVAERKIDPELIAGIRIVLNDEMQFDGSLKGKLDNVFNHI